MDNIKIYENKIQIDNENLRWNGDIELLESDRTIKGTHLKVECTSYVFDEIKARYTYGFVLAYNTGGHWSEAIWSDLTLEEIERLIVE